MYRDQRSLIESGHESVYGKFDLPNKILKENCVDTARGAVPSNPAGETPYTPLNRSPFCISLRFLGAAILDDPVQCDSMHNLFLQDVCYQYGPIMYVMHVCILHDLRVVSRATRLDPYVL